jgi:hypothetical protein
VCPGFMVMASPKVVEVGSETMDHRLARLAAARGMSGLRWSWPCRKGPERAAMPWAVSGPSMVGQVGAVSPKAVCR